MYLFTVDEFIYLAIILYKSIQNENYKHAYTYTKTKINAKHIQNIHKNLYMQKHAPKNCTHKHVYM